jgi:hypothetical protein
MKRIQIAAIAVVARAAMAGYDLLTGRLAAVSGAPGLIVLLGLFLGALAALLLAIVVAWLDRSRIMARTPAPQAAVAAAARGLRWSALLAVGFAVLIFANCTGDLTTTPGGPQTVAADPADFWPLAAWLELPLLVALVLPALLATAAQLSSAARPGISHRLAQLALASMGVVAAAAVLTVPVGFFVGVSQCDVGPTIGGCAAGTGSLLNFLSAASLGLFIPYLTVLATATGPSRAASPTEAALLNQT